MTPEKQPERLLGSMERPDSAKARVLDDDAIDAMIAEAEAEDEVEEEDEDQ